MSLALARATPWIPFAAQAERAVAKARRGLPADQLRDLDRFMRRILIGPPATFSVRSGLGTTDRSLLSTFERAFRDSLGLRFGYTDAAGRSSERHVEPHGLLLRAPAWYVLAWDIERDAARNFRMDRIVRPRIDPNHRFRTKGLRKVVNAVCPQARQLA